METLLVILREFGFPIVVTLIILLRVEPALSRLADALHQLAATEAAEQELHRLLLEELHRRHLERQG